MCVSFYQCFFLFFCGGRRESPCAQPRKPRMSNVYLDFTRAPISTGRRSSIRYNWGDDPRISFPKSVVDVQMLILRCGDLFTYHFLGLIFIYLFKSISIIHPFFLFFFGKRKWQKGIIAPSQHSELCECWFIDVGILFAFPLFSFIVVIIKF